MENGTDEKEFRLSRMESTWATAHIAMDPEQSYSIVIVNGRQLAERKVLQSRLLLSERASRIGKAHIPLSPACFESWIQFDTDREKDYEPEDLAAVLQVRCCG